MEQEIKEGYCKYGCGAHRDTKSWLSAHEMNCDNNPKKDDR